MSQADQREAGIRRENPRGGGSFTAQPAITSRAADEPGSPAPATDIAALVRALDHDSFAERRRAERMLMAAGAAALAELHAAERHPSAEVRRSVQRILREILDVAIQRELEKLATAPTDDAVDLELGMYLIAKMQNPALQREDLTRRLDSLADKARRKLGDKVDPRRASPKDLIAAIHGVLYTDEKFAVVESAHAEPPHSSLEAVLSSRRGLPIMISHIEVAVADRLGAPIVGIPVPGRYMVKYDGSRAPPGASREDIIIDPAGGGRTLSFAEFLKFLSESGYGPYPGEYLATARKRLILSRMLNNLAAAYEAQGKLEKATQALNYKLLFDQHDVEPSGGKPRQ